MVKKDFPESQGQGRSAGAILEADAPRKARDIARFGVATVAPSQPVYEAIRILVQEKVNCLPVVRDKNVVGMVAEKDILRLLSTRQFLPGLVEDYMTRDIICFDVEDELTDISDCLVENDFRSAPILYEGRLAGAISRADFIRAYQDRFRPEAMAGYPKIPIASDIMACGLLTVQPETPVYDAMHILATRSITGLPVVDRSMALQGIISEKDVLRLLHDAAIEPGKVEDYMTRDVVSLDHDTTVPTICECLAHSPFRRVPILRDGRVVGVVSRADVILYILRNRHAVFGHRQAD